MSDTWQGPGWRRADDGKWYPEAELAPPPPPPPPTPTPTTGAPSDVPPPTTGGPPPGGPPPLALDQLPPPPPTATPRTDIPPPVPPPPSSDQLPPPPFAPPPGAPVAQLPPPPPPPGPGMAAPGAPAPQAYPAPSPQYPATPPPVGPGGPGAPYGWAPAAPIRPVSTSLAGWVQGLFWAAAAISALIALAALNARNAFQTFAGPTGGFGEFQSWSDADGLLNVTSLIDLPVRLALAVVIIIWSWRCHKAAAGLNPGTRRWGSGWAVGGWFIPFASIVIPKLVIDETEKIAMAPRVNGTAQDWRSVRVSRLGIVWWWLFIASALLNGFASGMDTDRAGLPNGDTIPTYYLLIVVAALLAAVSAVCGALFVKDLTRALSHDGLYGTAPLRGVGGLTVAGTPQSSVDQWAARTSHATSFCAICREPLFDDMARCPRCGKKRQPIS